MLHLLVGGKGIFSDWVKSSLILICAWAWDSSLFADTPVVKSLQSAVAAMLASIHSDIPREILIRARSGNNRIWI